MKSIEHLLTEVEVAERHRRSVKTLQNERVKGGGIPFVKIGRLVRYRFEDILEYEANCRFSSTSAANVRKGSV